MDDVRYRLLGPTEILVDGRPARLPGGAERALLVLLLLSPGRSVPATTLIDRLWSESALPADPVNALQIRVSKLRRALASHGAQAITRDHSGYRIDVDESLIDAARFVSLLRAARLAVASANGDTGGAGLDVYDEALGLWVGEPLADFPTEPWARQEAARLTGLRLAALTERSQLALTLGRHTEVVADLEPVVAADPTLEALAGQLMTALYRGGRQADALAVFTCTRRVLDDELGLEPSASLRALHEQVLRQDAALSGPLETHPGGLPVGLAGATRRRANDISEAPGALPVVARALLGRDDQLAELEGLLSTERLVSLIGPGGAGKTSLALAGAIRVRGSFPDGAYGVRLAPVTSPEHVPAAVAEALGVPLDGAAVERDVRVRLARFLERRQLLLVVDNCEHLVDAAATLIDELLGRCEGLTVLATSREALAVPDELQLLVHPLETPPEGTPPGDVLLFPAAALFAERARMLRPGLVLPEADLLATASIARSLDGLPLAIELAAARVATMSPREIASRLEHRFELLTVGARTAESRQQTLRATVDWSYELLDESARAVFDRLSVFRGGWTLAAAEAVVSDDDLSPAAVLDTIGRLVERSLVVVEPGPTTRYRMLETLREYTRERLADTGLEDEIARRHAQYFMRFTDEGDFDLRGHGQREALERLRTEQPNIRAAISWWTGRGDADEALSMAGSLGLFWHLGRHLDGRETLDRVLRLEGGGPAAVARALQAVSLVERPRACLVHPSPRCAETAAESLRLFDELRNPSRAALSRVLLAVEGVTGAEPERSRRLLSEAEAQFEQNGDAWGRAVIGFVRTETALKGGDEEGAVATGTATATAFRQLDDPWGLSAILYHLGWGLRQFGRYEDGVRVLLEAIDVAASAGLFNTVQWALADLGVARIHLGDRDGALDAFDRAAVASDNVGDGAGVVLADYGRGLLAWTEGRFDEARPLFTDAADGLARLGTPVPQGLAVIGIARCDEADERLDRAAERLECALVTGRSTGEGSLVAAALEGLARVAARRGHEAEARALAGEAATVRLTTRRPATPLERRDLQML
ncbi:ATP-binding protein [Oryzobacter telluris]|uniref:ATP-binding protein n=1 Tax=Oryzobacter telluris TaxID=3149179 RepID=UPI00370D21CE